jgi:ParB/RepB/Spo0J family partition protein
MSEYRDLPIDDVHPSPTLPNPRGEVPDDDPKLAELAASIRLRGVLQPILVRPNANGFVILAGERRWRASKLAQQPTIPARILQVDDADAEEIALIENLQRQEMPPLQEADSYQRLVRGGRSVDEIAARLGKSKRYVYSLLTLTRLVPKVREQLARDVLPLDYALKLATIPEQRQEEALDCCFHPLFREEPSRSHLEPLATLQAWIERNIRLNPRSEDTHVLLPELAEQVATTEQEKRTTVLNVSTLTQHTDRSGLTKPILAQSWKEADGKDRCRHAKPAVIVLGDRRGTFLHVCIEKKRCDKHWPRPKANAEDAVKHAEGELARRRQEAADQARAAELERWKTTLRSRALKALADRTQKLAWSPHLLKRLLAWFEVDSALFEQAVGKPDAVPVRAYPQACVVALAIPNSWNPEAFLRAAHRLGVRFNAKDLQALAHVPDTPTSASNTGAPIEPGATRASRSRKRTANARRPKR